MLPDEEAWILIGFQRSVHSDRSRIRFTINLTVARKATWEAMRSGTMDWKMPYPLRPAPNTRYGTQIWQRRIGRLLPREQDKWWELGPDTDPQRVAADVIAAIRDFGLPALRAKPNDP
jgi:hypothetical protein